MAQESPFTFRRARPQDKPAVERLCAKIWDGDDYVPRCFDAWAADEAGELTLCFWEEQLAGISKLTFLTPVDAWLEGLRKDPDLPVKGVGRAQCQRYLARLAGADGLRSLRFSTYYQNHASIHLNEALGFRCIAQASLRELPGEILAEPQATESVQVIADREAALAFVRASGWFGPFVHQGWRSYEWSEAFFLERYLEPGHCLGVLEDGQLRALAAAVPDPLKQDGTLPFFDAIDEEAARAVLAAVQARFARAGVLHGSAIVPGGGARALAWLDANGWKAWEPGEGYLVYELPLDALAAYRTS